MAISIKNAKTNAIADWTQGQLDTIIAGGPAPLPPPGTTLSQVTLPSDWNTALNTSMATNKLLGRATAGTGVFEEISLGTNLSFTGTTLNATGGGGTPGGTDGDLQINDSGTFGTIDGLKLDKSGDARGTASLDIQSQRNASNQVAGGNFSTALGLNNSAYGNMATAIGNTNSAYYLSTAIGFQNNAIGSTSIAAGYMNQASGTRSSAFGIQNTTNSNYSTAIGYSNTTSGYYGVALGFINQADGNSSLAMGGQNTASFGNDVSIGYSNMTSSSGAYSGYGGNIAIGTGNLASGSAGYGSGRTNNSAIGNANVATGSGYYGGESNAFGWNNVASAYRTAAFGTFNTASSTGSGAFGNFNTASGQTSVAAGYFNSATHQNTTAVGNANMATGDNATALGFANTASGSNSAAFGNGSIASGANATALGYHTSTNQDNSTAIGVQNTINNNGTSASTALGYANSITDGQSCAFGYQNTASAYRTIAMGFQVLATAAGAKVFGGGYTNSIVNSTVLANSANGFHNINASNLHGFNTTGGTATINIKASTTSNASLNMLAGTAPTSPGAGDHWNDSTQHAEQIFYAGIKQSIVGCIFTQTATKTITNTITETSIIGSGIGTPSLPANFFVVGKTIRLRIGGIYTTPALATPSIVIKVKYGATVIATVTTSSLLSGATNLEFDGEVLITCRTTGATGTVMVHGDIEYSTGLAGTIAVDSLNNAGATTTIDTTGGNLLDVTITWDSATTTRSVSSTITTIEVLN